VRCRAHRPVLRVLRPRLHHGDPGPPAEPVRAVPSDAPARRDTRGQGHLDGSGDRRPPVLRPGRRDRRRRRARAQLPRLLPGTAVPAVRDRGPRRAAQRLPRHRPGDRPDRPARRPRRVEAARAARRRTGRDLVRRGPRVRERHSPERQHDPGEPGRGAARRRPDSPRRLDRAHDHPRPGSHRGPVTTPAA
jgi:hypothetical protein